MGFLRKRKLLPREASGFGFWADTAGKPMGMACFLTAVLIFLLLVSPGNSHSGLLDFSIQDEKELGQEFNILIRTQFPIIYDPVINDYLEGLLQKASSAMPPQPFSLSITLIRDSTLNAFAAPAGYIFVHTGMVLALEQESELAGVIAHELAHVSQRHLAERIAQSKLISLGTLAGMLAGALLGGGGELGQAVSMGSLAGGQAAALKYTRDNEREADQIGLNYLRDAGFDARGLLQSFKRMQQRNLLGGVSRPPAYMLTHPGIPERIHSLEDRLRAEYSNLEQKQANQAEFQKVQMLIRSKYADAAQALRHYQNLASSPDCLDLLGRGVALERLNRVADAEPFFQEALECGKASALVNREYGRFHFLTGSYKAGLRILNRAIQENPDDYLSLYYKARILKEIGELDQATEVLERIRLYLPEVSEIHTLLGQVYGRRGDTFKGYLHLAYSALLQNKKQATAKYIEKVRSLARTRAQKQALKTFMDTYSQRKEFW